MFIHSTSTFLITPAQDILSLKKELEHYTGNKFRRANRFILLSLIGVYKCLQDRPVGKNAAVYLTTENGNLGNTASVLEQIYYKQELPMPYNFINTMSNSASFYIAQKLNVSGRNLTISGIGLSFERGLELLKSDFALNHVTEAVIGGADESVVCNLSSKELFYRYYDRMNRIEGSAWLYIKSEKQGAVGELVDVKSFMSRDDAVIWLKDQKMTIPSVVSFGLLIEPQERYFWKQRRIFETEFDYIREYGYFDSVTSCGVGLFMEKYKNRCLVHINRDFQGRYVILIIKSS